jgi:hypothetical protein
LAGACPTQLKQAVDSRDHEKIEMDPSTFLGALLSTCGADANCRLELDSNKDAQIVPSNFVLDRDSMGRPIVWKIGGLVRQISYLSNGKIRMVEETGQLPPLATSNGAPAFLLSFETHDGGRTYIGRFQSETAIEPIVMTKLDIRSDGTIVTTDDSGLEMTWNPNNGESAAAFVHRNNQQETWIDHLDGTVTAELKFQNGVVAILRGRQQTEFCPSRIFIDCLGQSLQIVSSSRQRNAQVVATDSKGNEATAALDITLLEFARLLMQAGTVDIDWYKLESTTASISVQDSATGATVRLLLKRTAKKLPSS